MAKKTYSLGNVAGLAITAEPAALISFVLVFAVLSLVAIFVLHFPPLEGLLGGVLAALTHWLGIMLHDSGHVIAARLTGYPMNRLHFTFMIAQTLYPKDEPELPAALHIRRALGGPIMSAIATLAVGGILSQLQPVGSLMWYVVLFFFLDLLLFFTLGAFLPLGFTDGSTILYWLQKAKTK